VSDPEPPTFGVLRDQQYTERQIAKLGKAVLKEVVADRERDAGKVYCPCCRLRESRWRRHFEEDGSVRLFIYCTQCHKTGVREYTAEEFATSGKAGCAGAIGWVFVSFAAVVALWGSGPTG